MKVGDLVQKSIDRIRFLWGIGYIVKVHHPYDSNHIPFVSVYWPKVNKMTEGSQQYVEVI